MGRNRKSQSLGTLSKGFRVAANNLMVGGGKKPPPVRNKIKLRFGLISACSLPEIHVSLLETTELLEFFRSVQDFLL